MKILVIILLLVNITIQDEASDYYKYMHIKLTSKIYREVSLVEKSDFSFSPFSLQTVLHLLLTGAQGRTAHELGALLSIHPESWLFETIFARHLQRFGTFGAGYKLHIRNNVFVNAANLTGQFKKELGEINVNITNITEFSMIPEQVNEWIALENPNTIHRVQNRLDLILTNLVYFESWLSHEFKPAELDESLMYDELLVVTADFKYNYDESQMTKFLEIPFYDGDISIVIVVPVEPRTIFALENSIQNVLETPITEYRRVRVRIPVTLFKPSTISFKDALKSLGAVSMFNEDADFKKAANARFKIYDVIQSTVMDFTPHFVNGASASINVGRHRRNDKDPVDFSAIHPFIFYVKHRKLGILTIGRYAKP